MSKKPTILMPSSSSADLVPLGGSVAVPAARKSQPAPNALALLKALRRRWLLALTCALLITPLVAAGVWFGMPIKYTASTLLHVSVQEPRILGGDAPGYGDFAIYQKSQAAMITSRLVLNGVLKDAEVSRLSILPRDPDRQIDWLQQEIKVDFKTGPEFMRISMVGNQADEMRTLLNAVAAVYLKEIVNKERNRKQARLNSLKEIQSRYEEILRNRREAVRNLVVALGSGDAQVLAVKQRYANEALGMTEKELLQLQSEMRRLKLDLKAQETKAKGFSKELSDSLLEQAINKEPEMVELLRQYDHWKKKLDQAAQLAVQGKNEPALRPLVDRLKTTETELELVRKRLRPVVKERLLERAGGELNGNVTSLQNRLAFCLDLEKDLTESIDRLRKQTNSTNVSQADVELFRLDIAQAERIAERVATEVENLKVEVDAPRRVELLEEASTTLGVMERQRIKVTAAVSGGVLFFVVGFIAWSEYRHRRIDCLHGLSNDLGMRVVGALPQPPSAKSGRLLGSRADEDWQHILTEHVDATRTNLLHAAREKDARVVLVTSAKGGEGKTSLSCHLAGSLARAGYRTLLIDGDMRHPAIHRAFNIAATAGFSELLREEVELAKVVHPTGIDNLWMIAGGQWDQRATAALARTRLTAILNALREQYEYIIVDSAPLLPVVDSLLLGQHADGVIISVLREVSQLPQVHTAVERLDSVGVRILGVIMNGVVADVHSYRYGYKAELVPSAEPMETASL
jgi:succinoglycan biosynthesis transport protein ExoP